MHTVDAVCKVHNVAYRWTTGTPMLCQRCYQELRVERAQDEAVSELLSGRKTITQICQEREISEDRLSQWLHNFWQRLRPTS